MLRPQLNRIVVALTLALVLPMVAVAEQIRRGAGRAVARRGVLVAARLCGVTFEVRTAGHLDPSCSHVLVPNHSSPLDIGAMLVACPDIRFLAAAELFRIPLLAMAMRALGTVPIARRDGAVAREQLNQLARRSAGAGPFDLAIFAEGGIAPAGGRLPFKTGAFAFAIQAGIPVVPVAIHGADEVLAPHGFLAVRPGRVTVEVLAPVPTAGLALDDRRQLRDQVRASVVSTLEAAPSPAPA